MLTENTWFGWHSKAWHLLGLNYVVGRIVRTAGVYEWACVCRKTEFHQRELSGDQTWSLAQKRPGPPLLWQTSAFALRPSEISNLCLTHGKGQAHPRLPTGVEPEHFLTGPSTPENPWKTRVVPRRAVQICFLHTASKLIMVTVQFSIEW